MKTAAAERFASYVGESNAAGCREWLGGRYPNGYGKFWLDGRSVLAHRYSFELAHGPLSEGQIVRHSCDNPPCCEQSHLLRGTHLDNSRDCIERGRRRPPEEYRPKNPSVGDRHHSRLRPETVNRGERVGTHKLTEAQVLDVLSQYDAGDHPRAIARRFGVTLQNVRLIGQGKSWAHLNIKRGR